MEKKTLYAIVLSMIVLLSFQYFFGPQNAPAPADNATAQTASENTTATTTPAAAPAENVTAAAAAPAENATAATPAAAPAAARSILTLKNDLVALHFNETTGDLYSAEVLEYSKDEGKQATFNLNGKTDYYRTVTPIASGFTANVTERDGVKTVVFSATSGTTVVTKRYDLKKGAYVAEQTVDIANLGTTSLNAPVSIVIGPGIGEGFEAADFIHQGPIMYAGEKPVRENHDDVEELMAMEKPQWIGYTSKYFLMAAVGGGFERSEIKPEGESAVISGQKALLVGPGEKKTITTQLLVAPKSYSMLKSFGVGLEDTIDFGWFFFLAIPMLNFMNFLYSLVGNYGVAIILLTIVVKALTYPLTQKSMVSMKKMSQLQPEMVKLREKYKGEASKLNTAMMDLYKKHNVNPLGGCLPMLLQIPIFFALYKALLVSIELKGAPFFGWIVDLSLKDPYYITPVVMGATMFIQQKMTPSTADPIQQKMFMFMPIIFTFLFISFPSGLVVYWLVNNVLTIAQQYFINKKLA